MPFTKPTRPTAPPIIPPVLALAALVAVKVIGSRRGKDAGRAPELADTELDRPASHPAGEPGAPGKRPRRIARLRIAVGSALVAAGAALLVGSVVQFRRQDTTIDPRTPQDASRLLTGGVFASSRNPIYLGDAAILLGLAIRTGRPAALLPVAGFVALLNEQQIPYEEHALLERFGADYRGYCDAVPRWL